MICREKKPKSAMVRIVKSPEGRVYIDFTGKKSGRGAYICLKKQCIMMAEKKDAIRNVLKTDIPKEIYSELNNLIPTGGEKYGEN